MNDAESATKLSLVIDELHPQFALRAIRCANIRFGILPSQSAKAGIQRLRLVMW